MLVHPQNDGSLWIDEPREAAGFDLGNRSLFVKTNGQGDLKQIYFAHGAFAGAWRLVLKINDREVAFHHARAIGRLWELFTEDEGLRVKLSVFLDESMAAVFERISLESVFSDLTVEADLQFDITPPLAPRGRLYHLIATYLPRLPVFSWRWGWGMGRWLQKPAPQALSVEGGSVLCASGKTAWQFTANRPFEKYTLQGRHADISIKFHIPAGESINLDLTLAEARQMTAGEALRRLPAALQNAIDYAAWLNSRVQVEDLLLKSLYVAGLNASKAMYKEFPGGFKGLVAGPDYAYPPRIYFRDGYWTAQALLDTEPALVREHLLNLAAGVHPDGRCPSGVFAAHLLKVWHAPANCDADWLADHFDSPSYFILLLNDYLQTSTDWSLMNVVTKPLNPGLKWPPMTVLQKAHAAIEYLISRDTDGDGLIEKPYLANDWADNIKRSVWVSYDQGLYIAALRAYALFEERLGQSKEARRYQNLAEKAQQAMIRELWDEELGYFVNYRRPGFTEKNLSVDTLVTLYFDLLEEPYKTRLLESAKRLLVASQNRQQPFGNYGLLCAYPPYACREDLFDKSASPYRYHNGADWPYWDGMLASILLRNRDPLAIDVLTRWWIYGLEQGWLTPVEYYSPAYPVGGMLQGWSSMSAAVLKRRLVEVRELNHETA